MRCLHSCALKGSPDHGSYLWIKILTFLPYSSLLDSQAHKTHHEGAQEEQEAEVGDGKVSYTMLGRSQAVF